MTHRKRVLIVQYAFPPLGGAGVQRVLKFVKYLVALDWEVKVLTTRSLAYPVHDPSLTAEVPTEIEVIRSREVPMRTVRDRLMNPMHRLRVPGLLPYLGWPDDMVGWVPFAARDGLRAVDRFGPDVIFSSSPPASAHLVARTVAESRGIPWVADFRDPWTQVDHANGGPWLLTAVSARTEHGIMRHPVYVTVADDPVRVAGVPADDERRVVIHNGVDEADFPIDDDGEDVRSEAFSLTHVGSLYGHRDAAPVFAAIERMVASRRLDPATIEVRLVGNVWLGENPLSSARYPVKIIGYVPHDEAIREMRSTSVLLFYQPNDYPGSSGKIFEYLVAGRPILCVAQRNNLAVRLVEEFDAGVVVELPNGARAGSGALLAALSHTETRRGPHRRRGPRAELPASGPLRLAPRPRSERWAAKAPCRPCPCE
jgi:glycosyltransferase involved in cell wall biosynthesis